MTRLNYAGSILVAFVLGSAAMWAYQGHFGPIWRHLLAQVNAMQDHPAQTSAQSSTQSPALSIAQSSTQSSPQPAMQPTQQSAPAPRLQVQSRSQSQSRASSKSQYKPIPYGTNPFAGNALALRMPSNPFRQMARMQQQMNREMNRLFSQNGFFSGNGFFGGNSVFGGKGIFGGGNVSGNGVGHGGLLGNFRSWFSGSSGNATSITRSEDANSVYYKMHIGHGQNLSNVKVRVNHGYVSIDARLQNKSSHSFSSSRISESFPVPANVDPNSAKITRQGDSIVIRFTKV